MVWKSIWHTWQKKILERLFINLSNAYLFSWPKWIWKLQVAKDFWKNLLFDWIKDNEISRQIDLNIYQDFIILDKLWIDWSLTDIEELSRYTNISQDHRHKWSYKAKTNTITIDDVHELIRLTNKTPVWKRKVVIVSDIERMNISAFNALLKTLEDTPSSTIFLCTSSNPSILSPTLISRFQELKFNFMSNNEINDFLSVKYSNTLNIEQIKEISQYSFWRINSSIRYAKNILDLEQTKTIFKDISEIFNKWWLVVKLKRAELLSWNLELLEKEIENWFYFLRSKLFESNSNTKLWSKAIISLMTLIFDLKSNVNKKLALENYYLNL